MKKIILFVSAAILTLSLNGCSSNDDGAVTMGGKVTAKINGVQKTFKYVTVYQEEYTDDNGVDQVNLQVTAKTSATSEEFLAFDIKKGVTGADVVDDGAYRSSAAAMLYYADGAVFNVQTNSESKKLIGNFSGNFTGDTGDDLLPVTNGTFNISY